MVNRNIPTFEDYEVKFGVSFSGVPDYNFRDVSIREITLSESLLTPGLQTSILVDSYLHASPDSNGKTGPAKNFDLFKDKFMEISIERKLLNNFNMQSQLLVKQRIYRLDSRKFINLNNERFRVHACDDSLLNDARTRVSKSWKCTDPTSIVEEVLRSCAGVKRLESESSTPVRDYIAENIHPFQVVTQQANAALAAGNDPSFLHYMTYENFGTHHFKSLYTLSQQSPVFGSPFVFAETGATTGYNNPYSIITHSFPCDFDLLSDILNGIDTDGREINSFLGHNPLAGIYSLFGNQTLGCGIGGGIYNISSTNKGTEQDQDTCPFDVEKYLLRRQARMSLLEQDKIALKLTVPWNPELNVGKIIKVEFQRKGVKNEVLYGSGQYIIVNLIHTIKAGGFSTTTMDCVAKTAGSGIV